MEQDNFTVLENKAIGRNIYLYRKIRGLKAADMAERLGMKESSYTRYERGEGQLTVELIQQAAETLNVDPIVLMTVAPGNFLENACNSPNAIIAIHGTNSNCHTTSEEQSKMMLKLMESVIALNEKLMSMLEKREK